jgi:hypothetical protein
MKKFIVAAALAAFAMVGAARAADLSVKALTLPNLLAAGYTGSGLYIGGNMGGGGGHANVSASTIGSANLVDLQALIGVTIGYAYTMSPTRWLAAEIDVDMMNLSTSGNGLPLTLSGPMDIEIRGLYGFPIRDFLSMLPVQLTGLGNIQLPPFNALPAGVTATNSHMYVFAGVDFKDVSANVGAASDKVWLIAPEVGIGNRVQLSNGMAQDTSLAVQFDSKGMCVGAPVIGDGCGNIGMQVIGKLKLLY